jgi:predicted TPR repeat methyltransferase
MRALRGLTPIGQRASVPVTVRMVHQGGADSMPHKSLRDEWKQAKAANRALDVSKVADKAKFGPKLDKYETACEAYLKLTKANADDKKQDAAKKAVMAAARDAFQAGGTYLQALHFIEKNGTQQAEKAAAAKLKEELTVNLLRRLDSVAKGDMSRV